MYYDKVLETAEFIKSKINVVPETAIIIGSGLGGIIDIMEDKVTIPYSDIINFPQSSVKGHASTLVVGKINNKGIIVMNGRFHFYEGYTMKEVCFPIYVLQMLGVKNLIVTNACGAINSSFAPGELILINDYINMSGQNSLIGQNDERFGVRFPDMSEPYSLELINKAKEIANELHVKVNEGVYALFLGPCFESKAEIRAFKALGADVIGMSTVPETIAANYLNMKVLGIGCITNMATGLRVGKHSHEEVLAVANKASEDLKNLLLELLKRW